MTANVTDVLTLMAAATLEQFKPWRYDSQIKFSVNVYKFVFRESRNVVCLACSQAYNISVSCLRDPAFSRFDTIGHATDRQTDGRTDTRRHHVPC